MPNRSCSTTEFSATACGNGSTAVLTEALYYGALDNVFASVMPGRLSRAVEAFAAHWCPVNF
jgi:hypothetical protein